MFFELLCHFFVCLKTDEKQSEGAPKAIIAFYHGFSDHSKCFVFRCKLEHLAFARERLVDLTVVGNSWYQFFPNLASSGFEVHSLDQR